MSRPRLILSGPIAGTLFFRLAGDDAGVAADAGVRVDDSSPTRRGRPVGVGQGVLNESLGVGAAAASAPSACSPAQASSALPSKRKEPGGGGRETATSTPIAADRHRLRAIQGDDAARRSATLKPMSSPIAPACLRP